MSSNTPSNKSIYDDYDLGFGNKPSNTTPTDSTSTIVNPYKKQKQLQQQQAAEQQQQQQQQQQPRSMVFGKMAVKEEQFRDLKKEQDEKQVSSWDSFIYFMYKRPLFSISALGLMGSFLSGLAAIVFRKNFSDVSLIWSNSIGLFKVTSIATFAYYYTFHPTVYPSQQLLNSLKTEQKPQNE